MNKMFQLHSNLATKTFVADLPLCRVLLEDEYHYPWIFLVPRKPSIYRIMDLNLKDQRQFLKELDLAQNVMWELFEPDQLNIAAIGNKTPQLHVHIIARSHQDPAWPGTIWDHPVRLSYSVKQKANVLQKLSERFTQPDKIPKKNK